MQPTIGSFSFKQGTDSDDLEFNLKPGVAYFGLGGNDQIYTSGIISELYLDGRDWWIPSIASGGDGSDYYSVGPGESIFIYDASKSAGDHLKIYDYSSNIVEFFSVEGRSLFISTSWGTNILAIDALNQNGAIETIEFEDIVFSGSPTSLPALLSAYQTSSDRSIDSLISQGLFNPRAMGVTSAAEVRSSIDSAYLFNTNRDALSLDSTTMQTLYAAYYGRPGDVGGLQFWQSKIAESGFSYAPRAGDGLTGVERPLYDRLVVDFGNSVESQRLYAGKSAKESADTVYQYCFGRDAEIDPLTGENYWVGKLERNEITLSQLAAEVALGAQGSDLTFMNNRIEAANLFFNAMDTPAEQLGYSGPNDDALARNWLLQFGFTRATSAMADEIMETIVATI